VTRSKIHHLLYISSLLTIAFSLPLSMYVMTIGIMVMLGNMILEWNWKKKWSRLKENKLALILISFPLLFWIGFIETDHFALAINSYLMKLPMLIIPIGIATEPKLNRKEMKWIFYFYLTSVFITTMYSIIYLFTHTITDIREISVFISHIRFSLNIVLGIVIIAFLIWNKEWRDRKLVPVLVLIGVWFLLYLFISQTLTGISILLILIFFLIIYMLIFLKNKWEYKIISIGFLVLLVGLITYFTIITINYFHTDEKGIPIQKTTALGNAYWHNPDTWVENGHMIEYYICLDELKQEWPKRSKVSLDEVQHGLIRYLNSKGLHKDAKGVQKLTDQDIKNIENGYANVDYTHGIGLKRSLYPTFFSFSLYQKYGKIHQSSILERIELWKTSLTLIKNNWFIGVGVGDHKIELDQQLEKQHSEITKKEKGCHNQYLTIWLSGGIILLLIFLTMLIAPLFFKFNYRLLYWLFFLLITVSMFTEDTINTHAGVTFFSFFNALFLLGVGQLPKENNTEKQNKDS
jgi:hypothetical protein